MKRMIGASSSLPAGPTVRGAPVQPAEVGLLVEVADHLHGHLAAAVHRSAAANRRTPPGDAGQLSAAAPAFSVSAPPARPSGDAPRPIDGLSDVRFRRRRVSGRRAAWRTKRAGCGPRLGPAVVRRIVVRVPSPTPVRVRAPSPLHPGCSQRYSFPVLVRRLLSGRLAVLKRSRNGGHDRRSDSAPGISLIRFRPRSQRMSRILVVLRVRLEGWSVPRVAQDLRPDKDHQVRLDESD